MSCELCKRTPVPPHMHGTHSPELFEEMMKRRGTCQVCGKKVNARGLACTYCILTDPEGKAWSNAESDETIK